MEALMILAGGLLLVIGWVWLVITATRLSVGRMLLALFFPPLTLLLRGRGYPRWPRLLVLLGLVGLAAGALELHRHQPARFALLFSGQWVDATPAAGELQGTIMGQPFVAERIFWRGNDLVFEEGAPRRPRRALTIRFDAIPSSSPAGSGGARPTLLHAPAIERLPDDEGAWPELVLQWHAGALAPPGLRKVVDGYSLSLDFAELAGGGAGGRIHLHLPTLYSTWLTGRFKVANLPPALQARLQQERAATAVVDQARVTPSASPVHRSVPAQWQELSLLALLDEPELFSGSAVRLTTWSGRAHLGTFRQLSGEGRLILGQARGASQVELHFHPLDIRLIEARSMP